MAIWRRTPRTKARDEIGFGPVAYERLASRVDSALTKARARGRGVAASVTVSLPAGIDPLSHVAPLTDGQHWTSFEQPARDGFALATVGVAGRVTAAGASRFDDVARLCGEVLEAAEVDDLFDDPHAPPGSGVMWTGGFGFLDEDPFGDAWRGTRAADFVLPSAAITRIEGEHPGARLTLTVMAQPDSDASELLSGVEDLVERLRLEEEISRVADAMSGEHATVASAAPPEHYELAVERAASSIRDGEIEKIVLAREVTLRREGAIDVVNALRQLRDRFPECTVFAVAGEAGVFIGASPELLIRREGRRASTMALAGSIRRGEDPETDRHLGNQLLQSEKNRVEHDIVARRIERVLGRISAWVAAGEEPEVVKVKNIQHLATPIRAQLTEPRPVIELAGLLHPTPAVGGEPWPEVASRIRSLEGFDRGWYTGGVGWMDLLEDGEFHVALRSALVDGPQARLFAGAGIVGDSVPEDELAETETKLLALLPVLREC